MSTSFLKIAILQCVFYFQLDIGTHSSLLTSSVLSNVDLISLNEALPISRRAHIHTIRLHLGSALCLFVHVYVRLLSLPCRKVRDFPDSWHPPPDWTHEITFARCLTDQTLLWPRSPSSGHAHHRTLRSLTACKLRLNQSLTRISKAWRVSRKFKSPPTRHFWTVSSPWAEKIVHLLYSPYLRNWWHERRFVTFQHNHWFYDSFLDRVWFVSDIEPRNFG